MKSEAEKPHILVVDDDARLRKLLDRYLTQQDCIVITAEDAVDAQEKLKYFLFDIAILDIMMPGEDGISLAKKIRKTHRDLPLIMLTALGETETRIKGLEAGADDYLSKPFEPKELILRIQAILRRTMAFSMAAEQTRPVKLGAYEFDTAREELRDTGQGIIIPLTETERRLLLCLARVPGQVVSREELAAKGEMAASDRSIDVQVTRLRRKFEKDSKNPRYLHTIRGQGYVLRPDADAE
ncbi:MAG: response regulator [Pseudomonadota bacterium]|nr:response regulator [Pseudomonadota bacterium]QKK06607.1 MAG: response regulator [Pseudomonadota bacterium]